MQPAEMKTINLGQFLPSQDTDHQTNFRSFTVLLTILTYGLSLQTKYIGPV